MKSILLDTNAYSAFRRGNQRVFDAICEAETIYVSSIVLGELYVGFHNGKRAQENISELKRFLDKPIVELSLVTDDTAEIYSHLFLHLKRSGTPIPLNDVWIAAQCLELGAVLISQDQHFQCVTGLRTYPIEC